MPGGSLLGLVAGVALLVWLISPRRRAPVAPEDDVTSPIDREALEEAERELARDPDAYDPDTAEDDWGPGAG